MNVTAWCGHCGESFRLAELVDGVTKIGKLAFSSRKRAGRPT